MARGIRRRPSYDTLRTARTPRRRLTSAGAERAARASRRPPPSILCAACAHQYAPRNPLPRILERIYGLAGCRAWRRGPRRAPSRNFPETERLSHRLAERRVAPRGDHFAQHRLRRLRRALNLRRDGQVVGRHEGVAMFLSARFVSRTTRVFAAIRRTRVLSPRARRPVDDPAAAEEFT